MKVLVVDDDAAVGAALVSLLRAAGHHASHVATPDAALAAVRRHAPELVLLDVWLGATPAFGLCTALAALGPRVVLMSAQPFERDAGALGAAAFVPKSSDPALLLARLDAL